MQTNNLAELMSFWRALAIKMTHWDMCTISPCWQCQELRDDYYNARLDEANAEIKHEEMKIIKGILDAGRDPEEKVW
ncbi:MAG: hypothetical protein EBR82_65965 [Caulobacteraceae bacterium]|nr:hypothetical protein [Caulobacteraceae bacterium]